MISLYHAKTELDRPLITDPRHHLPRHKREQEEQEIYWALWHNWRGCFTQRRVKKVKATMHQRINMTACGNGTKWAVGTADRLETHVVGCYLGTNIRVYEW